MLHHHERPVGAVVPALEQFRRQWREELQTRRARDAQQQQQQQQQQQYHQQQQHQQQHTAKSQLRSVKAPLPLGVAEVVAAHADRAEVGEEGRPCPAGGLPDELLCRVLSFLSAASLCAASRVCRHWHGAARDPRLWRALCARQWAEDHLLAAALEELFRGSWFRMRARRPALRHDGVYCAKVSYVRRGVAEWTFATPVQTVVYYRYLRFLPDGGALWCTSFDQPYRRAAGRDHREAEGEEEGEEEEEEANPHLHGSVTWLMQAARVGQRLPRASVLGGVFAASPSCDGRVSVAVRCAQSVSTFELTLRLHRTRRRHLLQWLEYAQLMDAGGSRHEMNLAVAEAPVFVFLHDRELR